MTQEEQCAFELYQQWKLTNYLGENVNIVAAMKFAVHFAAAERSRLLEEAGMPDDGELSEISHSLTKERKPHSIDPFVVYERMAVITQLAMKEVRSRCSSLLMKEREKTASDLNAFDDWTRKNLWYYRGHREAIPGMEGWYMKSPYPTTLKSPLPTMRSLF